MGRARSCCACLWMGKFGLQEGLDSWSPERSLLSEQWGQSLSTGLSAYERERCREAPSANSLYSSQTAPTSECLVFFLFKIFLVEIELVYIYSSTE